MASLACRRALSLAAAAVLTALVTWPAAVATAAPPRAQPGISLLSQTPYVDASGTFQLRLSITAAHPATDLVEVLVFGQIIDRSDFDQAVAGRVNGYASYHPAVPLSKLPVDSAGGFDVNIPINQVAPPGSPFSEPLIGGSGVYPVEVRLVTSNGVSEAAPLSTFLTYASKLSSFPPLSVAVIVPFATGPVVDSSGHIQGPAPTEAARLNQLATVLNGEGGVPASILADPSTITALQAGASTSTVDRQTLAQLSGLPQGGLIEVLPSTYSPVSLGALSSSGLGGEAGPQLSEAARTLQSAFGTSPTPGLWVADGPVDATTLSAITAQNVNRLVVPAADLTPLPQYLTQFTFAQVTKLSGGENVLAADSGIAAGFVRNEPPVLAANQLLAELALIQTETPSVQRVVAVMPPSAHPLSADLIGTMLSGLAGDPLLKPVTVSQALSDTLATEDDLYRSLALPNPSPTSSEAVLSGDASSIRQARRQVDAVGSLFGSSPTDLTALGNELLVAESTSLTESKRHAVLRQVNSTASRLLRQISLPGSSSITLTATKGQLPITILSSSPYRPEVRLTLSSQRLIFHRFRPPGGSCAVPDPTKEICTFTLGSQNTTLKVPVETRSAGAFPLLVSLSAPDGLLMGKNQDTVRSTAVSGVGVILIAVAVLSLAIWWARDLRHGRRPRGMVPAPAAEPESTDAMSPIGDDEGQSEHGWRPSGDRQRL